MDLKEQGLEPKQVIVMRKDLNMRKGKMVAQGSHASMGVLLKMMKKFEEYTIVDGNTHNWWLKVQSDGPVAYWLNNSFAKICVSVDSEAELLDIYNKAEAAQIPACLITDSGRTEFNGVPTNTCIAIGPWYRDQIDLLTGHLKLL
jgi:PTH2 family peptidyl-tRNA hydrolase